MANVSDIRNGLIIEFKNGIYEIVEFLHVKPGKGAAFVRTKLRNMQTGKVLENTFRDKDVLVEVRVEKHKKQYLYRDGDYLYLMDNETYEQMPVSVDIFGEKIKFMTENIDIALLIDDRGDILGIELPITVIQEITEAEPNVKGNTASGGGKTAKTETGLAITVPFFVEVGTKIKIDTRDGSYIERV
ncbi:MAG: elongation factor P [Candidatus Cloacimonadales bacterium]|jgi:elongation factor P|nr:elongation factor P [Candidatus Cloacimonadota bacterium]MDD2650489.1 elongation factor P [Candidatus Cloacimonadota bacterium]MDD3501039.1 elongation factor P [Candidatus Cloacimonadota bacterium]MDX9976852.1 elongation factor P [Candidatus Cloacimonadales bacterium]